MRTLRFNKENATGTTVLSRAEMKSVMGGLTEPACHAIKLFVSQTTGAVIHLAFAFLEPAENANITHIQY